MPTDSLKKRYLSKLFANLIGLAISLVAAGIIPRGLGPKAYGDFSFLSNFFAQVVGFLDMGTSIGFYTKLSQRQGDFGLVSFYLSFACLISFLVFAFVWCAQATGAFVTLWPDQKLFYIYLASIWGILSWFTQILNKMADAYGVTVSSELAKVMQKGIGLAIILVLFFTKQLNLKHFFLCHYTTMIFLVVAFIWVMEGHGYSIWRSWKLSVVEIKCYIKEFFNYSHPLFVYALVGLIVGIMDRWLLQFFGGSVQQGFYGLSYRIGAICFLFTSAMTPLITREFAIAFDKYDIPEMTRLFRRYIPMLYAIAAYFACFIAVQAKSVAYIIGGAKFQHAILPVMIMAFYPIHQTYGQLSGSVFYATGQTRLYRNIGITFMLVSLPVAYFLLAPRDNFGLDFGATGLAIKMVALQFIGVNVQLWFNARLLKLPFWRYIGHQIISVGSLLGCAVVAMYCVDYWLGLNEKIVLSFLLSGFLYSLIVMGMIYFQPIIFGLKRQDISSAIQFSLRKLRQVCAG